MTFEEFILAHESDDTAALLLARARLSREMDDPALLDLAVTTIEGRRRLLRKVPEWYAVPSLRYPTRLGPEQCSSSATATLKASIARSIASNDLPRIADLTGGLGVDTWAFSRVFGEVLYNEMNPSLAEAAKHNFAALGCHNITVRSLRLVPAAEAKASVGEILGDFRPDVIFLDPARRAEDGRKVFRLADCQPDVLQLLPELYTACPDLLLKLSPMADITQLARELPGLRAVHIVGSDGECKELLLHLQRGYSAPYSLTIHDRGAALSFSPSARLQPECHRRPFLCKREGENGHSSQNGQRVYNQSALEGRFCANAQTAARRERLAQAFAAEGWRFREAPLGCASLRPLPLSSSSSLCDNSLPAGPSPCPCPGVDTSPEPPPSCASARASEPEAGWGEVGETHAVRQRTACEEASPSSDWVSTASPRRPEASGQRLLFEPGKALAKAGMFREMEERFGLQQAAPSTHLFFGESIPEPLRPFGKTFVIEEELPLNNQTYKILRKRIAQAEITARNIPLTSDQLRKKLGISSGGTKHLFGIRTADGVARLLVTVPKKDPTDKPRGDE